VCLESGGPTGTFLTAKHSESQENQVPWKQCQKSYSDADRQTPPLPSSDLGGKVIIGGTQTHNKLRWGIEATAIALTKYLSNYLCGQNDVPTKMTATTSDHLVVMVYSTKMLGHIMP
jgi:hypothetical protein